MDCNGGKGNEATEGAGQDEGAEENEGGKGNEGAEAGGVEWRPMLSTLSFDLFSPHNL
jgi:hypothetical protein